MTGLDSERRARVALSLLANPGDPVLGAALRTMTASELLAATTGSDADGQALLIDDDTTTVVLADIREPDKLLAMPGVDGFLDFSQPIGLILNAVIHHVLDEEDPYGIVSRYKDALAPGSYMQLTHFCDSSAEARVNEQVLKESLGRVQIRSREQIERFFDGLDLVEPGLVYLPEWRPDEPVRQPLDPGSMLMLVGVARKP